MDIVISDLHKQEIEATYLREKPRLMDFIRRRIPRSDDAEDILQDVFFEFVNMYRLMKPVEQTAAWLFRVTRNKITDRFRKKKEVALDLPSDKDVDADYRMLTDILPIDDHTPETEIFRESIMLAIESALNELPASQREVFVWHELEGKSFQEIMELTGASLNTLLSRKRYAVLFLRKSLQELYDEMD